MPRLVTSLVLTALLAGCGTTATPGVQQRAMLAAEARATQTLKDGFKHVYAAAFGRCDANADGMIDEYEAGPTLDLRDFQRADENRDGKLSNAEFQAWATRGGLFGLFKQDQESFFRATRKQLLRAFDRLDADKTRTLTASELNDGALTGANLALTLGGLKTRVQLTTTDEDAFAAADKTGDGVLSQAEFEDLVLDGWVKLVNPAYQPQPEPQP